MPFDHLKRRELITLVGGSAVWPLAARAQQPDVMRRIGVLMNSAVTDTTYQSYLAAFLQGLRQLGWNEGQALRIDVRWSAGNPEVARSYAAQLLELMPDVILATSSANLTVIQQATSTVPVVFLQVSDPVAQGFVPNLTRPGGNLTGLSSNEFSMGGKWVDLLKEAAPGLARVAIMFNPDTSPQSEFYMRSIEAAAASLGVRAIVIPARATAEIEPALANFTRQPNGGLILPTDAFTRLHQAVIADLAVRIHLPSIAAQADFPKNGGLMFYGVRINTADRFRQAATYVDRILRGAKPGDLPVQREEMYTLSINLKTAKALGLTVPPNLLAAADEVIE
jgi:putative ABC transport system substrate-binding protein